VSDALLNFDDWVGDYQVDYFRQIDDYLAAHPAGDADLVFVPSTNNFEQMFTMRSATVDQE